MATNKETIERIALIHVVANTTDINLSVARHILLVGTRITGHFPRIIDNVHLWNFRGFLRLRGILATVIRTIHVYLIRIRVCAISEYQSKYVGYDG